MKALFEKDLNNWIEREKAASKLSGIVVDLWYDKSVELVLFRKKLFDKGIELILKDHLTARKATKKELTVHDTLMLAEIISHLDLSPSKIDIGRLCYEWLLEKEKKADANPEKFIKAQLSDITSGEKNTLVPKDVVLFGFGRIGRIAARLLIEQTGKGLQLRLRAIAIRGKLDDAMMVKRAELLRNDSIFGPFRGTVVEDFESKCLIINGQRVQLISAPDDPGLIDYSAFDIHDALLIDNTGSTRNREGLSKHLNAKGIEKVLLTAPGQGDIPNIVYGINHDKFSMDEKIWSAASCTTNAIVPPLKIIDDFFGIEFGHIETVHSYTNDQNLLDNYHKKSRRGRAAALNLVITETGAGKAVTKALPNLQGKITGNSVRIPTPDGSLAILNLVLQKRTTKEELNEVLKQHSLNGRLIEQIGFSENEELVSSDILRDNHACIVDGPATIVAENKKNVILYVWYDNEWGYTEQVIRLAKYISGVLRLTYF